MLILGINARKCPSKEVMGFHHFLKETILKVSGHCTNGHCKLYINWYGGKKR